MDRHPSFDDALAAVQGFVGEIVHVSVGRRSGGKSLAYLRGVLGAAEPHDDGVEPEGWFFHVRPVDAEDRPLGDAEHFGFILDSETFTGLAWSTVGPSTLTLSFANVQLAIMRDGLEVPHDEKEHQE